MIQVGIVGGQKRDPIFRGVPLSGSLKTAHKRSSDRLESLPTQSSRTWRNPINFKLGPIFPYENRHMSPSEGHPIQSDHANP